MKKSNKDVEIMADIKEENNNQPKFTDKLKASVSNGLLMRAFWMLTFTVLGFFVLMFAISISVVQWIFVLLTSSTNKELAKLHTNILLFITASMQYVFFLSDTKPYPFSPLSK